MRILIYGATGYMGRLLADKIAAAGAKAWPIETVLAARSNAKLAELVARLGEAPRDKNAPKLLPVRFSHRSFELETPAAREARLRRRDPREPSPNLAIDAALIDVDLVLNVAGPFGDTAEPLAKACIRSGTTYVDIGGEHDVFSKLSGLDYLAHERGVALLPGVGLTALGSDLLTRMALQRAKARNMGPPHVARVAISRLPSISRGSARTMLDSVRDGVLVRQGGVASVIPIGRLVRSFDFGANDDDLAQTEGRLCTALTLADSFTIRRTINEYAKIDIPNVETYVEASAIEQLTYQLAGGFALALRSRPLKDAIDLALSFWPEGPLTTERDTSRQQVVVEIEDRYRRAVRARLLTPNSYDFTAEAAMRVVKALAKRPLPSGLSSPAAAFTDGELADTLEKTRCKLDLSTQGLSPADRLNLTSWKNVHGSAPPTASRS